MGLNDSGEMLEAAKAEVLRLERIIRAAMAEAAKNNLISTYAILKKVDE